MGNAPPLWFLCMQATYEDWEEDKYYNDEQLRKRRRLLTAKVLPKPMATRVDKSRMSCCNDSANCDFSTTTSQIETFP